MHNVQYYRVPHNNDVRPVICSARLIFYLHVNSTCMDRIITIRPQQIECRHHNLGDRYEISISQMAMDLI